MVVENEHTACERAIAEGEGIGSQKRGGQPVAGHQAMIQNLRRGAESPLTFWLADCLLVEIRVVQSVIQVEANLGRAVHIRGSNPLPMERPWKG